MLSIEITDGFAEFDPFTTELSQDTLFTLGPVVQKAKQFLKGKTKEDLQTIIQKSSVPLKLARDKAKLQIIELARNSDEGIFTSECSCLHLCKEEFESDLIENENCSWSEVFATISLANVGLLYSMLNRQEPTLEKIIQERYSNYGEILAEMISKGFLHEYLDFKRNAIFYAMEAITYASIEKLEEQRRNTTKARLEASKKSQQEKFLIAKKWVCEEYQAIYDNQKSMDEKLSLDEAAYILHSNFPPLALGELRKAPTPRTIASWIGQFKNNNLGNLPEVLPFKP